MSEPQLWEVTGIALTMASLPAGRQVFLTMILEIFMLDIGHFNAECYDIPHASRTAKIFALGVIGQDISAT